MAWNAHGVNGLYNLDPRIIEASSTGDPSQSALSLLRQRCPEPCLSASSSKDHSMSAKFVNHAGDAVPRAPTRKGSLKRLRSKASLRSLRKFFSPDPIDDPVPPISPQYLTPPNPNGAFTNPYGCQQLISSSSVLSLWGSAEPQNLPSYRCSPPPSFLPFQPAFDPLPPLALPKTSRRLGISCWINMSSATNTAAANLAEASEASEDGAKPPLEPLESQSSLTTRHHTRKLSTMSIPIPERDDKSLHYRPTSGTGAEVYDISDTEASTAPGSPKAADSEIRAQIQAAKLAKPIGHQIPTELAASVPSPPGPADTINNFSRRLTPDVGSPNRLDTGPEKTITPGASGSIPASANMSRHSSAGVLANHRSVASSATTSASAVNASHTLAPSVMTSQPTSPVPGSEAANAKSQPFRGLAPGKGDSKVVADKPAAGKSVFGKFFDKKEGKETGAESDGGAVGKMIGRKPSGKKTNAPIQSNGDSISDHEGAGMARQASTGASRNLIQVSSEKATPEEKYGSKFRDMVAMAPKLGRRPSSSRGARSDDGKSDDDRQSRAGSQATASLLKKYGVCEKAAIGKGATAVVRLAHKWDRGTDKLYAVKEFRKRRKGESEREYVKKLTSEFCISSTLHHDNVVETVDLVQDENHHWCEVMEYCPGGDLYAAIKRGSMSQAEINSYLKQILAGVTYLHSMGVAHRDIKPENLLLDARGHLKITDFGVSDVFRMCWEKTTHLSKGLCGSEPYLPKEMFERKEYDARLVDVWACAIVYYCCCMQELPWRVAKPADPSFGVLLLSYNHASPSPLSNLPRESRAVMKRMLHPDPEHRPQMDIIMTDSWVKALQVIEVNIPPPTMRERM